MTLHELSKQLGLSVSTISRAFSRPDLVSPKTRKKVLESASAYGFTPNAIAQSLKNGRTKAVGIVVSDIQNPFYSSVVREVERSATSRGYNCVICNADEDAAGEERALELLLSLQVAGIIHASTGANETFLRKLQKAGMPLVEIDRTSGLGDVDTVLVDNAFGARLAADHLLNLGHRRIAVVTGPQSLTTGRERLEGFRSALEARSAILPTELIEIANFREEGGYSATLRLLALPELPTAIFVANNEMMAGALSALRENSIQIPSELSLISFDDVRWARYVEPPLTVIAQPTAQIGTLAAGLLFERLAGRHEVLRYVLKPKLVRRASCAPPGSTQLRPLTLGSLHSRPKASMVSSLSRKGRE